MFGSISLPIFDHSGPTPPATDAPPPPDVDDPGAGGARQRRLGRCDLNLRGLVALVCSCGALLLTIDFSLSLSQMLVWMTAQCNLSPRRRRRRRRLPPAMTTPPAPLPVKHPCAHPRSVHAWRRGGLVIPSTVDGRWTHAWAAGMSVCLSTRGHSSMRSLSASSARGRRRCGSRQRWWPSFEPSSNRLTT